MHQIERRKPPEPAKREHTSPPYGRTLALLCGLLLTAVFLFSGCEINPKAPDRYALIYGVADYGGTPPGDLNWTDKDAISVAQKLEDKGYEVFLRIDEGGAQDIGGETNNAYGFEDSEIKEASLSQMKSDIQTIKNKADKNSIVLWFFSGHGTSSVNDSTNKGEPSTHSSEDEWLIPYSSSGYGDLADYSTWNNIALSDNELALLLQELPSKKNVIIIDACLSGGFIGSSYDVDTAPQDYSQSDDSIDGIFGEAYRSYFSEDSADFRWKDGIAITASGEQEFSYESSSIEHGFFTLGLLKGFSKDKNNDGYISTMELYRSARGYVERKFNDLYTDPTDYLPRISGGSVDYVLFEAD